MTDISQVTCCVVDHGLFPHIAQCMAEQCNHVYYAGPPEEVMEKIKDGCICDGFENVTRVKSLWEVKNQCDLFVFTDIGFAAEQKELVSQGFPVWGHHGADELECRKGLFLDTLKELGMAVPPHRRIKGMDALREYLLDEEDKYIKISRWRGDWETMHWRNWTLDACALDCAAYRLGPVKNHLMFYVFDKIDTIIEDGIDTWCIDGKWPTKVLHGMERKDKSFIGAIQKMSDIQEDVRGVNEKFGPVLGKYGYRGPFSTEVRLADESYFIDPTCRFGSPPSQLQTALIKNLPQVIWAGANGEIEEPDCGDEPVGAQALITSDRDKDEWLTFTMDKEFRPYVKSAFSCEIDDEVQILPNPLENWAGWLVATGKTIGQVIETLKERVAMLPDGFECDLTSLCDLLTELEEAREEDVEITKGDIPEPATVLES